LLLLLDMTSHMFESSSQAINFTTIINNKYNFRSHANPKLVQLLAACAHMSQLQWCSHAPNGPLEDLLATHHSGVASWHLVLNNTSSTKPKVQGGPIFDSLKKVKRSWRENGVYHCRIDMPCTFEPNDGLPFSVEGYDAEKKKAASQHACFRAIAHMLAADQRKVRLMDCHWNISITDLRKRITDVLHQFPAAASSSFDQFPAAASSDIMLPKPLAVEPPSEQCLSHEPGLLSSDRLPETSAASVATGSSATTSNQTPLSAASLKALCGDDRQLRKHRPMTTATGTALGDGMLAAVVPEQCSSASGIAVAAKKARPNRSSQKPQSKTAALSRLAPIAEATIQDKDTSSALDGLLQEPCKELAYLERMD